MTPRENDLSIDRQTFWSYLSWELIRMLLCHMTLIFNAI